MTNTNYISQLSDGTNTYTVKDAEARTKLSGKQDTITSSNKLSASLVSGLASVATSGSYNDLSNKPTIPTVNNATLIIQKNGSNVATFTANASSNVTANISVPNVTSTYTATGTDAVNGVAVSNAIATKQDNLVSGTNIKTINGTSLLGSGNIEIQGGSSVEIDEETITENSDNELQVEGIINQNTNSGSNNPLKIWQGSQYEFEHGTIDKTWYAWKTNPNINIELLANSSIPIYQSADYNINKYEIIYSNGTFITAAGAYPANDYYNERSNLCSYSIDNGETWQKSNFTITYTRMSQYGDKIAAGNGIVLYCMGSARTMCFLSNDDGANFDSYIPANSRLSFHPQGFIKYCNDRFIAADNTINIAYDYSGEWDWQYSTLPTSTTWNDIVYGNGIYVVVGNNAIAYSTDECTTWQSAITPRSANWISIVFADNKFVITSESGKGAYSTDAINWISTNDDLNGIIKYGNGTFVVASNTTIKYSLNLNNWYEITIPDNRFTSILGIEYGNGHFIIISRLRDSITKLCFDLTINSAFECYTIELIPTASSKIYSEPEIISPELTVSSVSSGAITLSDNNTYYYDSNANQYFYLPILTEENYLYNINNNCIKIGDNIIADKTPENIINIENQNKKSNINPLKLWYGTENDWNTGAELNWYYFKTKPEQMWLSSGTLPFNETCYAMAYGGGRFVLISSESNKSAYSTDDGVTWTQGGNLPFSGNWYSIAYGDGRFVAILYNTNNVTAYSTDGGITWIQGGNLPFSNVVPYSIAYGNGRFVVGNGGDSTTAYSTDGGVTWIQGGSTPFTVWRIAYGDGRFVGVGRNNENTCYSTDGGITWIQGGNLGYSSNNWIVYGNGKFVTVSNDGSVSKFDSAYSTDGGITWHKCFITNAYYFGCIAYGNEKIIAMTRNNINNNYLYKSSILSMGSFDCYTNEYPPKRNSIIYSAPNVISTNIWITSISESLIKIYDGSDYWYYYTPSGNQTTIEPVGDIHPEYLCFIDGKGIKIGNNWIAQTQPTITTEITSSSTDDEIPTAKSVYDLINT